MAKTRGLGWTVLNGAIRLTPEERRRVLQEFGSREDAAIDLAEYARGWLEPITAALREERIQRLRSELVNEEAAKKAARASEPETESEPRGDVEEGPPLAAVGE